MKNHKRSKSIHSSVPVKPPRLSRLEGLNKNENGEIEDQDGLEADYRSSIGATRNGCESEPLPCPVHQEQHTKAFGPSMGVLVVCPVIPDGGLDGKKAGDHKFQLSKLSRIWGRIGSLES